MRKHTLTVVLVLLAVLASSFAGASAGRLMPTMGQLFGVTAAGAASLSVEAIAPLAPLTPTGSGFTYQGMLKDRTNPARGLYDFEFTLYDDLTGGTQVGGVRVSQTVNEGLFTVVLDFGADAFNGDARYLEIAVRPAEGEFTTLSPRQPITPAPYALFALKTKGYKNMLIVSPEGGDFTSIQAALNSITTNSATNKYLVWVGPGTYTEQVTMKEWVDIEGSGELTTRITFTGSASPNTGTVVGASNAELRSLTVENTGGNTYAIAIFNSAASPSLLHVTVTASGGTFYNLGVFNDNSSPSMNNVTATASGGTFSYGVYNDFSSPSMINVTATASGGTSINYGVWDSASSPSMNNVTATASGGTNSYGVSNSGSSPNMNNVTATASGGTFSNTGVYNDNSSSPSMNNVTVTASGGTNNYGVYNSDSSPNMTNMTVTASGGINNYGVYNYFASPNMTNMTVTASGGTNYGVYNDTSSPSMNNVTATASGGTYNIGVYTTGSSTVTINNSVITGNTYTIAFVIGGGTVKVGASKLNGGPVYGSVTCAGVYDENYVFFASTCP